MSEECTPVLYLFDINSVPYLKEVGIEGNKSLSLLCVKI